MISRLKGGFTLVEILVGTAVLLVVAVAAYGTFSSLFKLANANQAKLLAVALADEQFEIVRNMPYASIGIQNGIPRGSIPEVQSFSRGGFTFLATTTIRNIDLPFDGQIGSTTKNDLSPADNKLVEIDINCPACKGFSPVIVSGQVAPKNLESASTNGALFVQAFDANGVPVSSANVHVTYVGTTTPIIIDDTTDTDGMLQIVDAPPGVNKYSITVSKSGYSTEQTYIPGGAGNPNPTKPHATVAVQQVTQASFAIDKVSSINFSSVTPQCVAVPNFDFTFTGTKQIGASLPKYSQSLSTNSSGILNLSNMEWDTYTLAPTDTSYDLAGLNPLNPISISPNTSQNIQLIAVAKGTNSLLVTVKDSSTQLPISGATVRVTGPSSYDNTQITGQGYINQTDWSGGSGQSDYVIQNKYYSDDTFVDTSISSGNVVLKKVFGNYNPNGTLESSTFDVGTTSNFYSLIWSPSGQPVSTGANSVRMQFATNPELTSTTTWNYLGPDGTSATYYTSPSSSLNSVHNGGRYARYKLYLSTNTSTTTPTVSDTSFTYTSACTPPGQVIYSGIQTGTYSVTISKSGYTTWTGSVTVHSGWQEQSVLLGP